MLTSGYLIQIKLISMMS